MSEASDRPSPVDTMMYQDPAARIGCLLSLTGTAPSLDALRVHVAGRLRSIPALTQTLTGTGPRSRWVAVAPNLDLHIRGYQSPPGASMEETLRSLRQRPLPEGAPPWEMTLLRASAPGEFGILFRVNHGLQDFGGIVHTLEALFAAQPVPPAQSSAVARSLIDVARPSLRDRISAATVLARTVSKTGLWVHPVHGNSRQRSVEWASVPTDALRAAARTRAGTVNDAYLTAVARALLRWMREHQIAAPPMGLPMSLAVNLRRPATLRTPGNQVIVARITLPARDSGPAQYLTATAEATAKLKSPAHREAIRRLTCGAPHWLTQKALGACLAPEHATVAASNFVMRHPLHFAGSPVHAVDPLTFLPDGFPASTLMVTYQGRSAAVFVTDSALPGLDAIHLLWHEATQELCSLSEGLSDCV